MIHKSNSFQTCSQSFNKIICSQKFYLPFKGNSQSARVPWEHYLSQSHHLELFGQIYFIIWTNVFHNLDKYIWKDRQIYLDFLPKFYLPFNGSSQSARVPREHCIPQSYHLNFWLKTNTVDFSNWHFWNFTWWIFVATATHF